MQVYYLELIGENNNLVNKERQKQNWIEMFELTIPGTEIRQCNR